MATAMAEKVEGKEAWLKAAAHQQKVNEQKKSSSSSGPSLDKRIEWARQEESVELDRFLKSEEGNAAAKLLEATGRSILLYDDKTREEDILFTSSGFTGRCRKTLTFQHPYAIALNMSPLEVVYAAHGRGGQLCGRNGITVLEYLRDELNFIAKTILKQNK